VSAFIDSHRERFGVEPICRVVGVSASAYCQRATGVQSARSVADERLFERIREVHQANYEAYGYRRTWKALVRAGEMVPRCQVQRLMRAHGIQGAKRRRDRGQPLRADVTQTRKSRHSRDRSSERNVGSLLWGAG
jgi:putative transposase